MPSSYTSSARFNLQATGENNNTWGVILNQGVFQLVDDSVCGRLAFALSGAKALTVNQGATDEARMAFLDVTGGAGGTITVPSVAKGYFIHNGAAGVVNLSAGGPLLPINPGDAGPVFGDGTTVYPILVGGLTITAQFAAMKSYVDSAIAGAVVGLPAMIGHAGQLLTNDGTVASWGPRISDAYAFRNRLINGAMEIDQRHAGAAFTPTVASQYSVDRWTVGMTQPSKFGIGRSPYGWGPPASGCPYVLQVNVGAGYAIVAADTFTVLQSIEGRNIADLLWGTADAKPVVLSFWAYASIAGTYGGALRNNAAPFRSFPFSFVLAAATWTRIVIPIPGDVTGTWASDNTTGISVFFSLGSGATFSAPAGVWAAGNFVTSIGAVSLVATAGASMFFTAVQLEAGVAASAFERRPPAVELTLCQRYYCKTYPQNVVPGTANAADSSIVVPVQPGGGFIGFWPYPVNMRAQANVTMYSHVSGAAAMWYDLNAAGDKAARPSAGTTNTQVASNAVFTVGWAVGHVTADAEL